jgi:arsenate reductase-like glutaredoxin family protein
VNIQIFGKSKCFDTKKAERYFKERRIKYQYIDIDKYGMSRGEFQNVLSAVGLNGLINDKAKDSEIFKYLAYDEDKAEKLFEEQRFIKTPVVRNGKKATAGYEPETWAEWE